MPTSAASSIPLRRRFTSAGLLLVLAIAMIGLGTDPRDFAKFRVGPLYALDGLFLCVAFFIALDRRLPELNRYVRDLWPALALLVWGSILLAYDLLTQPHGAPPARILQHCIIFVYPIAWLSVGYWTGRHYPSYRVWLAYLALILCALPNLAGRNVANIAIGPLLAVPFLMLINRARTKRDWGIALGIGYFALLPFWWMWMTVVQRTSVIVLVTSMIFVPILSLRRSSHRLWPLRTTAIAAMLLVFGSLAAPYVLQFDKLTQNIWADFLTSMQHGEDFPNDPGERPFQFRTRKSMWNYAVADWRTRPWSGVGFLPEVPSSILPGIPNTGGFETPTSPPVSGPHNSYLTFLVRMGPIGLGLVLALLLKIFATIRALSRPLRLAELLTLAAIAGGLIYATFNVGLEAPHYSVVLWLFAGALIANRPNVARKPASFDSSRSSPTPHRDPTLEAP